MRVAVLFALCAAQLAAADFKAGLARAAITPQAPIRMPGYGARTQPSEGVAHDLWAKALALDDGKGGRAVIVALDLATLPTAMADEIAARITREHGLPRQGLVLNCSHTHAGPVVRAAADAIVRVAGQALKDLAPAPPSCSSSCAAATRPPTPAN